MPLITYESWAPNTRSWELIDIANDICTDYRGRGYDLTLRQLYYQFVARGHIENTQRSYKNLGNLINKARMAGLLDWDHITDRTRNLQGLSHWDTPAQIIRASSTSYRLDRWEDQRVRVEVWVEKEALAGVVARAANRWDVDYFSCRGYVSQSEQWRAAGRLRGYIEAGQRVIILHLGDHDPSGVDMTRDITDRITNFISHDWAEREGLVDSWEAEESMAERVGHPDPLIIDRIALNMNQILEYAPPPNPAKITDSRAADYIARFGNESWELDALPPDVLDALISSAIEAVVDPAAFADRRARESREREILTACSSRWAEVTEFLEREQ